MLSFCLVIGCGLGGSGGGDDDDDDDDGSNLSSCGDQSTFFTVAPLDSNAFTGIEPLGATNPPGHTFPTGHTYLYLADKTMAAPVYAPGDVTITSVQSVTNESNQTDYTLDFYLCDEVKGYFLHVTTLSSDILDEVGGMDDCRTYTAGTETYTACFEGASIEVTAGTVLGYAGGPTATNSGALDFGVRDTRIDPIFYANTDLFFSDEEYVVCHYDYYKEGSVKDSLLSLLQKSRTDDPICGTLALDIANAAQGKWYLEGTTSIESEAGHLSLVPSNKDTDIGVLSVGNSTIDADGYFFDFVSSGQIRRRFSDVTYDNNVYCYDSLREYPDISFNLFTEGYLFLQMTSNTTLTLERVESGPCPESPNSLTFSSAAVNFER